MKQISLKIRKYGAFVAFLLVLSMMFGAFTNVNVYADADNDTPTASNVYEKDRTGSITVKLQDIATQETTNKAGVELTLYKVADIDTTNNYIEFKLVSDLAGSEILDGVNLNDITTGEANIEAAQKLEDAVLDTELKATDVQYTDVDGVAVFEDNGEGEKLDQGMYLIQQTNANAYGVISPLLVAIPYMTDGANWIYDVVAEPKGAEFNNLGSIQVTKALKYNNDGNLLDTTAENASYDIGLFMDSQGLYRYGGDNWKQTVTIQNASSNVVTFDNLPITSKPYYIFELDENGNPITYGSGKDGTTENNLFTVMAGEDPVAENAGTAPEVILDSETNQNASAVISNVYADLPDGYYVTGEITITKSIMDNGKMINSNYEFYAGIFAQNAQGNVSASPTEIVKLTNNGSVTVEVPLGGTDGTQPITYMVKETDETGKPVDQISSFPYTVTGEGTVNLSMDQTTGTINLTNTLGTNDGYYREEPTTEAPSTREPGSNNNDNNSSSSNNSNRSSGSNRSSSSTKTGDNNQIMLYAGLFAAAVIIGGVVVVRRRRRNG